MFTSITSRGGALVTAVVVLTGGAILRGGAAAADPSQDEHFLALLDQEEIPALHGVPSLIATAHKICHKLDGGMPVDAVVDDMRNNSLTEPNVRQFPARRINSTIDRFITASVEAYCPGDEGKISSIMANPAPRIDRPIQGRTNTPGAVLASLIGAVPSGELTPDPPEIPAPPPPSAPTLKEPPPIAAPPPRRLSPPPPKQPPPPPEQAPPSAGGGGTGDGGPGAGPVEPSPEPSMPPGWVRLAP